jgi:hypothetical protein
MHFRHFSDKLEPKGGVTLAYQLQTLDDQIVGISYGFALCTTKDHYNKRIGKLIAGGRLEKHPEYTSIDNPENWFNEVEQAVITTSTVTDGCVLVNSSRGKQS